MHYSVLSAPEADDEDENDEKEIHQEASSCQLRGALDRSLFLAPHSSHHHLVYTYPVGAPRIHIGTLKERLVRILSNNLTYEIRVYDLV